MTELTLIQAQTLVADALAFSRDKNFNPLAIAVLDTRGALKFLAAEDGVSLLRWKIAVGKAYGALSLGIGSRRIGVMAVERPHFVAGITGLADSGLVPVAGGVLIRDSQRQIVGALGISGDSSDNDEAAAVAAIAAGGLIADGG